MEKKIEIKWGCSRLKKKPVASSALRTMTSSYRNTVNTDPHIAKNLYFGGSGRKVLLLWGIHWQFRLRRLLTL